MNLGHSEHLTIGNALTQDPTPNGKRFATLFEHGSLQVEIYAPRGTNPQQPHIRDEVYVVVSGSGFFFCDGVRASFSRGDFLFVPAGVEHRFEDITDDLSVWVLFYGPEGGEATPTADRS